MADAQRTAEAVWEGSLAQGEGAVTLTSSGAAGPLPVTWASRTTRSEGKTSPEELVAAAHASCYCMALSHILGAVSYTHLRAHETRHDLVCRLLLDKKKNTTTKHTEH